jgi:hypothetical protein
MQVTLSDEAREVMRRIEIENGIPMDKQLAFGMTLLRLYLSAKYAGRRMVCEDIDGREKELISLPID